MVLFHGTFRFYYYFLPSIFRNGFNNIYAWEQRKLEEVCSNFRSGSAITSREIAENGMYPVYGGNGLRGYTDMYTHDGNYVLIGRQGVLCGNINYTTGKAYISEHAIVVGDNELSNIRWLEQVLRKMNLNTYSESSAQPGLSVEKLKKIMIFAPSKDEQTAIGSFFRTLDDTITLHKRKLDKLKELKKGYLQKMFPQAGESVPRVRFTGFIGPWEVRKLGEVVNVNPRSFLPDSFEYVDLESVVGTSLVFHRTENKDTAPSRAQRVAKSGDVFFQMVRPYQRNNYLFDLPFDNYVFSTGYAQLRPKIDSYFLLCKLQEENFVTEVLDHCTGTSYPAINSTDLAEIYVNIAIEESEQTAIGDFFRNLDDQITAQQQKLDQLKQLKAAYLQKMFI